MAPAPGIAMDIICPTVVIEVSGGHRSSPAAFVTIAIPCPARAVVWAGPYSRDSRPSKA
ncbi:hypothetical protein [Paenirhodobacter populi]|uniref:hypothetical protein n=1 Tax=Paenirhodobacter populi TaxID=2306993 RepID=UPI001F4E5F24|nr:hypothetical protein [Sinirhodobacter populi]